MRQRERWRAKENMNRFPGRDSQPSGSWLEGPTQQLYPAVETAHKPSPLSVWRLGRNSSLFLLPLPFPSFPFFFFPHSSSSPLRLYLLSLFPFSHLPIPHALGLCDCVQRSHGTS